MHVGLFSNVFTYVPSECRFAARGARVEAQRPSAKAERTHLKRSTKLSHGGDLLVRIHAVSKKMFFKNVCIVWGSLSWGLTHVSTLRWDGLGIGRHCNISNLEDKVGRLRERKGCRYEEGGGGEEKGEIWHDKSQTWVWALFYKGGGGEKSFHEKVFVGRREKKNAPLAFYEWKDVTWWQMSKINDAMRKKWQFAKSYTRSLFGTRWGGKKHWKKWRKTILWECLKNNDEHFYFFLNV